MRRPLLLAVTFLLAGFGSANAQWSASPAIDNLMSGATGNQSSPEAVSDGAGGVIAVWIDPRTENHSDLYAQRIDAGGVTRWSVNGAPVDTTSGVLGTFSVCSDDSGGVLVAWWRQLGPVANRIWVQRVDANGQRRWGAGGIRAGLVERVQDMPHIVRDGSGGALVLWANWQSNAVANIYGQRLSGSGARLWSASGDSVAARGEIRNIAVVERPAGGAYIAWWQTGSFPTAAAVGSNGGALWPAWVTLTTGTFTNVPPTLTGAATGDGVMFLCSGSREIYARRIGGTGTTWASDVRVVSGNWFQGLPRLVADAAGGAIVSWLDYRTFSNALHAQRLRFDGVPMWLADGELVSASVFGGGHSLLADGAGGAWYAWANGPGAWVQHCNSAGVPWLPPAGVNISSQHYMNDDGGRVVGTDNGGLIVVAAGGNPVDIWAKRVFANGALGTVGVTGGPRSGATLALSAGPNPARERITLSFELPRAGRAQLEVFGLRGERVATLANEALPAGEHARTWKLGDVAPGVYHARLTTDGGTAVTTIAHVR